MVEDRIRTGETANRVGVCATASGNQARRVVLHPSSSYTPQAPTSPRVGRHRQAVWLVWLEGGGGGADEGRGKPPPPHPGTHLTSVPGRGAPRPPRVRGPSAPTILVAAPSLLLLADADVQTERAGPSPLGRGCRHLNSGGGGVRESKVGAAATASGVCVCVCTRGGCAPRPLQRP